jgi:hypothetical protein
MNWKMNDINMAIWSPTLFLWKCVLSPCIYFWTNGAWQQKNIYKYILPTVYMLSPRFPWFTTCDIQSLMFNHRQVDTVLMSPSDTPCHRISTGCILILHVPEICYPHLLTKWSRMQQVEVACSGRESQFVKAFMCPVNSTSHYTETVHVKFLLLLKQSFFFFHHTLVYII